MEPSPHRQSTIQLLYPRLRVHCRRRDRKTLRARGTQFAVRLCLQRICGTTPTKNYKQLRNTKSGRDSLPKERTHQLVIQCQIVMPENMYMQIMLYRLSKLYLCIHTHMYATAVNKEKTTNLKENKEGLYIWEGLCIEGVYIYMRGFGGEKGEGKTWLCYWSQKKKGRKEAH